MFSQPSQGTLYESSYGPVLSGIHHQTMTAPLDPVTFTQALNELGVTTADYITKNYATLFLDWKRESGSAAVEMTFGAVKVGRKSS